jgi:mevalonate kinase
MQVTTTRHPVLGVAPARLALAGPDIPHASYLSIAVGHRAVVAVTDRPDDVEVRVTDGRAIWQAPESLRRMVQAICTRLHASRILVEVQKLGVPVGAGLGMSTAIAVAATNAVAQWIGKRLSTEDIVREVSLTLTEADPALGPRDTSTAAYGGAVLWRREGGRYLDPAAVNAACETMLIVHRPTTTPKPHTIAQEVAARLQRDDNQAWTAVAALNGLAARMGDAIETRGDVAAVMNEVRQVQASLHPAMVDPGMLRTLAMPSIAACKPLGYGGANAAWLIKIEDIQTVPLVHKALYGRGLDVYPVSATPYGVTTTTGTIR